MYVCISVHECVRVCALFTIHFDAINFGESMVRFWRDFSDSLNIHRNQCEKFSVGHFKDY